MGRYANDETVVDNPHPLVYRVTQDDIDAALSCDTHNCMHAVAVTRLFGPEVLVSFGATRAFIKRPGSDETWRYVLPANVIDSIREFDESEGASGKPGIYELPVCRPSQRIGVPRSTRTPGSTGQTRPGVGSNRRQPFRFASKPSRTTVEV